MALESFSSEQMPGSEKKEKAAIPDRGRVHEQPLERVKEEARDEGLRASVLKQTIENLKKRELTPENQEIIKKLEQRQEELSVSSREKMAQIAHRRKEHREED